MSNHPNWRTVRLYCNFILSRAPLWPSAYYASRAGCSYGNFVHLSVRPSVRLLHSGIVSKRIQTSSNFVPPSGI